MSHDDFNLLCPKCGNTTMSDYNPEQGLYDEQGECISYYELHEWDLPKKVRFEIRSGQADCSCGFVFESRTLVAVGDWITISKIIPTKEAREKELKAERKKQYDKLKLEFEKLSQEIDRDDKE